MEEPSAVLKSATDYYRKQHVKSGGIRHFRIPSTVTPTMLDLDSEGWTLQAEQKSEGQSSIYYYHIVHQTMIPLLDLPSSLQLPSHAIHSNSPLDSQNCTMVIYHWLPYIDPEEEIEAEPEGNEAKARAILVYRHFQGNKFWVGQTIELQVDPLDFQGRALTENGYIWLCNGHFFCIKEWESLGPLQLSTYLLPNLIRNSSIATLATNRDSQTYLLAISNGLLWLFTVGFFDWHMVVEGLHMIYQGESMMQIGLYENDKEKIESASQIIEDGEEMVESAHGLFLEATSSTDGHTLFFSLNGLGYAIKSSSFQPGEIYFCGLHQDIICFNSPTSESQGYQVIQPCHAPHQGRCRCISGWILNSKPDFSPTIMSQSKTLRSHQARKMKQKFQSFKTSMSSSITTLEECGPY